MRARLGAVLIAASWGVVANVGAQPRPRPAPPPPPAPYAQPQRTPPPSSGPANRRPPPPANNPYRGGSNSNSPQPYSNSNSPPPYTPNNGGYNGNAPAYDPYTDPRQPPPTPPPYTPSNGGYNQGNSNSPQPYSNSNSPPPYTPNNGGYNGNTPPYRGNGNSPPPPPTYTPNHGGYNQGNSNSPQPYSNNNSPPPYTPNNGGYNGNSAPPYNGNGSSPPPPPSPPYGGYNNGGSPGPYSNGNSPPPYSGNSNSPPPYQPNNGGYNGNAPPPPATYVPPPSPTPTPYTNNGNDPPPSSGNSNSPAPYTGGNSSTSSPPAPTPSTVPVPVSAAGWDACLGDAGMGGSTYGTRRQRIDVVWPALPDAYVKLIDVTNGCGPGQPTTDTRYGDDSDFVDSDTPDVVSTSPHYYVNFRSACLMHDAGYSGVKTDNIFTKQVVDYFDRDQKQVDDQFFADMLRMCDEQIPARAKAARENCKTYGGYHLTHGAMTRYKMVQTAGALVAWKGRPALTGGWSSSQGGSWSINHNKRSVTASWTLANPDFRGEFRGTLISRDADSSISGHYVIYEKGVARCQPVVSKWTWEPGKKNEIVVTGPGGVQYLKR